MKWERLTQWAEVSDCGRYTVAMVQVHGRWYHEAWRRATTKDHAAELLVSSGEADEARAACEEHAEKAAT
jgi:hypothetical protein